MLPDFQFFSNLDMAQGLAYMLDILYNYRVIIRYGGAFLIFMNIVGWIIRAFTMGVVSHNRHALWGDEGWFTGGSSGDGGQVIDTREGSDSGVFVPMPRDDWGGW